MRKIVTFAALAAISSAGMAAADYYLKIEGASRPSVSGPVYLKVVSTGDLDGDGRADEGIVRVNCTAGKLTVAQFHHNVKSPRDSASGMASGKRTHHPVTFVKEWGAATPQLREMKVGYNVKSNTGGRMTSDGWQMLSLSNPEEVCAAAATVKATKTRSNIQNN